MVLRYSIVRQLLRFNQGGWLNFCALAVGFLCILGLAIVAAYPVSDAVPVSVNDASQYAQQRSLGRNSDID